MRFNRGGPHAQFFYSSAITLTTVCFVTSLAVVSGNDVRAQVAQPAAVARIVRQKIPALKQIPLTEKQIRGALSAIEDVKKITDNSPDDIDRLSMETTRQLDAVAERNGLLSYKEYNSVIENIGLVTAGFDPVTRKYLGFEALIKTKISRVRADKKLSDDRRKEALTALNDQLQFIVPPIQNKGNIALVAKYYDQVHAAIRDE